jgi:hypothetical protein
MLGLRDGHPPQSLDGGDAGGWSGGVADNAHRHPGRRHRRNELDGDHRQEKAERCLHGERGADGMRWDRLCYENTNRAESASRRIPTRAKRGRAAREFVRVKPMSARTPALRCHRDGDEPLARRSATMCAPRHTDAPIRWRRMRRARRAHDGPAAAPLPRYSWQRTWGSTSGTVITRTCARDSHRWQGEIDVLALQLRRAPRESPGREWYGPSR